MTFKLFFENNSQFYYHGSDNVFNIFSSKILRRTDNGYYGYGFYFSPSIETARMYGANLYKCKLDFKNPLKWNDSVDSLWEKYGCIENGKSPSNSVEMAKKLTQSITSEGYDSIIVNNYENSQTMEVCVYDPKLITMVSRQLVSHLVDLDEYT